MTSLFLLLALAIGCVVLGFIGLFAIAIIGTACYELASKAWQWVTR